MMNLKNTLIVDIECDGLLDTLTKLHVLSVGYKSNGAWHLKSTTEEQDIAKIFSNPNNTVVGHYFLGYDILAIQKLYPQIEIKATIIDTLSLSWYLYNERPTHGLGSWGETLGFAKVKVEDEEWTGEGMTAEEHFALMKERCEGDVNINILLWEKMLKLLRELYENDDASIISVIKRCNFKINLANIQAENKILVDIPQCKKNLAYLQEIIDKKTIEVNSIMPGVSIKIIRNKPKILFKKDGTPSSAAIKWNNLLLDNGVDPKFEGVLSITTGYTPPNCSSTKQMKEFLFTKGWKPSIFSIGANGAVPQLRKPDKTLCDSILKLIKTNPELESLDGLSVAIHRSGYLKAFLDCADEDGYINAGWSGMAKTFRVKHVKPIVNLPANSSQYGDLVRSVLIAPEGKVFVNADLSSLEDKTKQVCIFPYDPEYVETLNIPGYDAHLNIAKLGGFMSDEELDLFKWYKSKGRNIEDLPDSFKSYNKEELSAQFKRLSKVRQGAKTVNYSAVYGASKKKLSEAAEITIKEATKLYDAYWGLNWSVRKFADDLLVKSVEDKNWIYSPYSKTWLILTADHIKFSAVNQNFGATVFDLMLWYLIQQGVQPIMSVHDELSCYINKGEEEDFSKKLEIAMDKVNEYFNFPIKFEAEPEFATSYGNVH
jgi:DNA polymerase I-like protein with 3'-5' exonuclease and polymerase domains